MKKSIKPIVWTIAGSDSGGGAGIQADLHTFQNLHCHGASVITALTAQNSIAVNAIEYPSPEFVKTTLDTLQEDLPARAIKLGMLGTLEIAKVVAEFLKTYQGFVVCDPVMVSTSGATLLTEDVREFMVGEIFPQVDLITPNLAEAELLLTSKKINTVKDMEIAAHDLLGMQCKAVLLKGGHLEGEYAQDYFCDQEQAFWLSSVIPANADIHIPEAHQESESTIRTSHQVLWNMDSSVRWNDEGGPGNDEGGPGNDDGGPGNDEGGRGNDDGGPGNDDGGRANDGQHPNNHGSGCTLSSAITASIALDNTLPDALVMAKAYVTQGIHTAAQLGQGPGPVKHTPWPVKAQYMPTCSDNAELCSQMLRFAPISAEINLYPIVDRADWLEKLLPTGITTIQLRIKNLTGDALETEIQRASTIAKQHQIQLFINDHWELALKHNAYGIHLGQEDLQTADLPTLAKSGIRLGISTHSYFELAQALAYNPSYIAFGPIFPTTCKSMKFGPQGIEKLQEFRKLIDCPLVAIGGINEENLSQVLACHPDGVAMISAITKSPNPVDSTKRLHAKFECQRNK